MALLEPRRSRYLRALGIDVYVPRHILPGALPSSACEWEEAASAPESRAPADAIAATLRVDDAPVAATPVVEAPSTRDAGLDLSKLTGDLQAPSQRRSVAEKPAVAPAAKPVVDVPKIALSIAVGAGGILVVDDAAANAGERNEYLKLLGNLLFALHSDAAPAIDVFVWPMLKQPQLDRSAEAARETLAAHIQNQLQRHAVHTVLLLGEAAQRWCAVDGAGLRCATSVSALACLRQPALKRQLWNDIRHLAAVH